MKGPLTNLDNMSMDFEQLPLQAVALSPQLVEQAVEISDCVVTESRQWQTYLNALALFGLQTWLAEQAPDLVLDWQQCSLLQPQYANLIEVAYDLRIEHLKLCIVSASGAVDSGIKLPRAVVDLADFRPHFYILVQVFEEQAQVQVLSFLRHDQWLSYHQANPLQAEPDWSYRVPVGWFDDNLHRLLLYLRCLEPEAGVEKAAIAVSRDWQTLQQDLIQLLAQAEAPETPLWQLMPWEEGARVLTSPPVVDWLYAVQTGRCSLTQATSQRVSPLRPVFNAGAWLRQELDDLAQAFGWILLPPQAALRSPAAPKLSPENRADLQPVVENLALIRQQLSRDGNVIPGDAGCVYKSLSLAGNPLGLYAITWVLPDSTQQPVEWALLLVLKLLSDNRPTSSMTLAIDDQTARLAEHRLNAETDHNSIYAQVVGDWHESFQVTLTADTGETISLPPFAFSRGKGQ